MTKIYISSTYGDLKDYRDAVYRTLRRMDYDVVAMEDYVATGQSPPLDKCLVDVASCDLYVGIFAWRYGYIPDESNPTKKSITELEYRQAQKLGKPCFIFLLDEHFAWLPKYMDKVTGEGDNGKRIEQLRQELSKNKLVSFFKSPDELANLVGIAIRQWEKEHTTPQFPSQNLPSSTATPSASSAFKTPVKKIPWNAVAISVSLTGFFFFLLIEITQNKLIFKREQTNPSPLSSTVKQSSTFDSAKLENLLKAKNWKEADRETAKILLSLSNREQEKWIDRASIENISCPDIQIIDKLWQEYSRGKFGFTVQNNIWRQTQNSEKFGEKVGWRKGETWLTTNDLNYTLEAPIGHLPSTSRSGNLSSGWLVWYLFDSSSKTASCLSSP